MATHRIYKEQIEDVFVLKSVYNLDMANKANIDGSNTIGGVWQVDNIFSNRFTGAKGVFNALSGNIIEWGNADLVTHRFLANNINALKVKVGSAEYNVYHSGNLINVSQLNNNAGYLQANDLDGFAYDVIYNGVNHQIIIYRQNRPNIVIDLPIESLIKGVALVGNNLVFTFEDGSTASVPLNTLLVGVVKFVNGKAPNSNGEVVVNIGDIPALSSTLNGKANVNGNNLTNIADWRTAIPWNLQQVTNNGASTDKTLFFGSGIVFNDVNDSNDWSIYQSLNGINFYNLNISADVFRISQDGLITTLLHGTSLDWSLKYTFPIGGNSGQYVNGLGQLATFPTPITYTGSNGVVLIGNDFQLTASVLASLSLANSAVQPNVLNGYVNKAGDTMSGVLGILSSNYEVLNLNSNNPNNYVSVLIGQGVNNLGFTHGVFKNTSTPLNSFYHITPYGQAEGAMFKISSRGDVGIGTQNPQAKLHVNGNAIVSNATALTHAVNLGQLNTLLGSYATITALNNKVDKSTTITINGVAQDLSTSRTWTIAVPTVNNGSFVVQGVGALTGAGTTSANASANTTATLDLTQATKDDIADGKTAYNTIQNSNFASNNGFDYIQTGGSQTIQPTATKTTIAIQGSNVTISLQNGVNDGDECSITSCGDQQYYVDGTIVDKCGNQLHEAQTSTLWWWHKNDNVWYQAI